MPDEATAQAVANAFLKSVGEAINAGDQAGDNLSSDDDNQVLGYYDMCEIVL